MRRAPVLLAVVLAATACSNLGLGESHCSLVGGDGDVSSANILNAQAVPTARYTPCIKELRLGWDSVTRFAEEGEAGINISRSISPFLTATVRESCDVGDAVAVESGYPDIQRFEDIEFQPVEIEISIVPSGERPLLLSRVLIDDLAGVEIDDRPVTYTVYDALDQSVSSRVTLALLRSEYVLIIDEVDSEEGTVQLRSNYASAAGRGLQIQDALDMIEDVVPTVSYRGNWFFTFEGGCITYEFNARGTLAETIAADAEDALGFYPAFALRDFARQEGFNIG